MATGFADSAEVISAIDALAKEKKINKEVLYSKIESALVSAYKRSFGKTDNVRAVIDRTTGQIEVLAHKNIVENVVDPAAEISLTDVRANYPALSMYGIGEARYSSPLKKMSPFSSSGMPIESKTQFPI